MDMHCDVIKDLLPLYMEDMASCESSKLVEAHLSVCTSCQTELEEMKAARVIPLQTNTETLRHVKTSIAKRRLLTAFTAVMAVVCMYLGICEFLSADIWIPAEAAVQRVEQQPDGTLRIYTDSHVNGSGITWAYNGNHVGFLASMRMEQYLFPKAPVEPESVHTQAAKQPLESWTSLDITKMGSQGIDLSANPVWYVNIWDGTAGMPLWNAEEASVPEGPIMEISYLLFYCCGVLLILAAVLGILSIWISGKAHTAVVTASILCLSLVVGIVLTSGGQLVTYFDSTVWMIRDSLVVAIPMFFTSLSALKLYQWKKQDEIL